MLMLAHLEPDHRENWLIAAVAGFPHRREPWCELAQLHAEHDDWRAARAAARRALAIREPADDYLTNPFAWGTWPDEIAARASAELGDSAWARYQAVRNLAGRARSPKVAVYTIARDEETDLERWTHAHADADVLLIADTGSTDRTVSRGRELGIDVRTIEVEPFRFDHAYNRALDLLPLTIDMCVCVGGIDEVLDAGWRDELERCWRAGATRVISTKVWDFGDGRPPRRFNERRIHVRHGYRWRSPIHEQLITDGDDVVLQSGIVVHHLRDASEPRPSYLHLLQLGAAEAPYDGRFAHMLADELVRLSRYQEARAQARLALSLELNREDRKLTWLMLARLEPERREDHILAACAAAPESREPWCELAQVHADRGDWRAARAAAQAALRIAQPPDEYLVNVAAWGYWPDQLAGEACDALGDHAEARAHLRRAQHALARDLSRDDARAYARAFSPSPAHAGTSAATDESEILAT
jgi:hypothetical protein